MTTQTRIAQIGVSSLGGYNIFIETKRQCSLSAYESGGKSYSTLAWSKAEVQDLIAQLAGAWAAIQQHEAQEKADDNAA